MARQVPEDLYRHVFELVTAVAQPENPSPPPDNAAAKTALAALRGLFESRASAGEIDPFLTETMADFTEDDIEAVQLYRLALQQCAAFPGEPTHSKRQSLAERLLNLGLIPQALKELNLAVTEAFAAGDIDAVKDLNCLLQRFPQ